MDLAIIQEFDRDLPIRYNGAKTFANTGVLAYDIPEMLSYSVDRSYCELAGAKGNVVALFVKPGDADPALPGISLVLCEKPLETFFLFHNFLIEKTDFYNEKKPSLISAEAKIHPRAFIADYNVIVEKEVTIAANATVLEHVTIKRAAYIGPNTVIGIDGTQTIAHDGRKHFRIAHGGSVFIDENAFIGAGSVIVRSLFRQPTFIGKFVTIGNLVNIGHNCAIEDEAMVLANSCVCGSTRVGKGVRIAPGATISSSRNLHDEAIVTIGAVVTKDVPAGQRVSGHFAIEHSAFIKQVKAMDGR